VRARYTLLERNHVEITSLDGKIAIFKFLPTFESDAWKVISVSLGWARGVNTRASVSL